MFKAPLLAAFLALFLAAATAGVGLLRSTDKDKIAYQKLLESSKPLDKRSTLSYSQQKREHVIKEVWFREKQPLHFRILSDQSELFFFHNDKNKIEVVEEMQKVRCTMQEELFYQTKEGKEICKQGDKYFVRGGQATNSSDCIDPNKNTLIPMQHIRYFEAETASYHYNSKTFIAEDVKLWKYKVQGHTLPTSFSKEKPLMTGTAESAEFLLKGEDIKFSAYQLKAVFDPKKGAV